MQNCFWFTLATNKKLTFTIIVTATKEQAKKCFSLLVQKHQQSDERYINSRNASL